MEWDRDLSQKGTPGCDHALLDPVQTDASKINTTFAVAIDSASFPGQADLINLQMADQQSDREHQQ